MVFLASCSGNGLELDADTQDGDGATARAELGWWGPAYGKTHDSTGEGKPFASEGGTRGRHAGGSGPIGPTSSPVEDSIYDETRRTPDGFVDLSPPLGPAFDRNDATPLTPPPPPGWSWYSVAGTSCRDGSEAGLFIHFGVAPRLLIYFEGGGACTTGGFCQFNPSNVNQVLSGTGETVLGSAVGAVPGRQQPGAYQNGNPTGIFSTDRADNPFHDWSIAYVPYCTGDVHFGTRERALVPGLAAPQHFVGHLNARIFVGRLATTFAAGLERVVVTGASAGSFGAGLNFGMVSDAFAGVQADLMLDSGIPFDDAQWPACLQQRWRDLFGLDAGLPPDCTDCFNADGGGLANLSEFWLQRQPDARVAVISSMHDEVIRLFFTPGDNGCATIDTADPIQITLGQLFGVPLFSPEVYEAGLFGVRARLAGTGQMASYYLAGPNITLHQHTFRPRFFEAAAGGLTLAQFTSDFLAGSMAQVGP